MVALITRTAVEVIYGAESFESPAFINATVFEAWDYVRRLMPIPPHAYAVLNSRLAYGSDRLAPGDTLQFIVAAGRKGTSPRHPQYKVVYADPPWQYRNFNYPTALRGARRHYPTMPIEEIMALPVRNIVADDALLFIWIPDPLLPEGLRVIEAWGFNYKGLGFSWLKENRRARTIFMGMGLWTRKNQEICWQGNRGRPQRRSCSVHSVVIAPVGGHSEKPSEVRERIVELVGDVPRIELFAREKTPGWHVWGNEVESDIDL